MKAPILVILVAVGGCASHTGIVPLGNDQFMSAKQQATGFPGLGTMKAELIVEGTRHCEGQGKKFELVAAHETQGPYVLGRYPRSEIQFKCVASR